MDCTQIRTRARRGLTVILILAAAVSAARAQQPADPQEPGGLPSVPTAQDGDQKLKGPETTVAIEGKSVDSILKMPVHKFWDRDNDWLFAAVGAGRALDYTSTLNLRRRGIDEAFLTNSIVDNHPLFAGIEVAVTAASVGVSYIFHRTGHHRLERWTSAIHAGIAVGGSIRNYALKTPHAN